MKNNTIEKTRYKNNGSQIYSLGLLPGEDYGQAEECSSHITEHTYNGQHFEVYFDEMAGPFTQWKAFSKGIGTISDMERSSVITKMQVALENSVCVGSNVN